MRPRRSARRWAPADSTWRPTCCDEAPAPPDACALLEQATLARRNADAVLEWVVSELGLMHEQLPRHLAQYAASADACDALRWLVERAGFVPDAHALFNALLNDAGACVDYLLRIGMSPPTDAFKQTMLGRSYRAMARLVAHLNPSPDDRHDLLKQCALRFQTAGDTVGAVGAVRAASLLRRSALLPRPGIEFLRRWAPSMHVGTLAMAGYRVDADVCDWLESLRPHCAGTSEDEWRRLGLELYMGCNT